MSAMVNSGGRYAEADVGRWGAMSYICSRRPFVSVSSDETAAHHNSRILRKQIPAARRIETHESWMDFDAFAFNDWKTSREMRRRCMNDRNRSMEEPISAQPDR